jgi:hypothetical protein
LQFQDFDKDAIKKFIEVSGFPTVLLFDADPTNHKYLERYYTTPSAKVSKNNPEILFLTSELAVSTSCAGSKIEHSIIFAHFFTCIKIFIGQLFETLRVH